MDDLSARLAAQRKAAADGVFKPYLDTFGAFTVVEPQANRVEFDEYVIDKLEEIGTTVGQLQRSAAVRDAAQRAVLRSTNSSVNALLNPQTTGGWTAERQERLIKMWNEGATASQIAGELGSVSRNAVIGKAHRLGLEQRPSPAASDDEEFMKYTDDP
jgi:GcrA cell cycle regulator